MNVSEYIKEAERADCILREYSRLEPHYFKTQLDSITNESLENVKSKDLDKFSDLPELPLVSIRGDKTLYLLIALIAQRKEFAVILNIKTGEIKVKNIYDLIVLTPVEYIGL